MLVMGVVLGKHASSVVVEHLESLGFRQWDPTEGRRTRPHLVKVWPPEASLVADAVRLLVAVRLLLAVVRMPVGQVVRDGRGGRAVREGRGVHGGYM